jgi:hypothetical protein
VRVFEDRMLKRTGPEKEVAGGWRRLHKEELHILYASPNVMMRLAKYDKYEKYTQYFGRKT